MDTVRKLKPDRSLTGLIPAFGTLAIFFSAYFILGTFPAVISVAFCFLLYAVFSFITSFRTGNTGYTLAGLYQVAFGLACIFITMNNLILARLFFVFVIFFGLSLVYFAINKKLKWRGREIFELAAAPVTESEDGFTSRPLPSLSINHSKDTIQEFAKFMSKNLIALTHLEKDKIVFFPVIMGEEYRHLLRLNPDYQKSTWISFDFEGKVTVNISQKDYLNYKENLTFNQLCESLGHLFVEFLDLFRRGEGERIIDRMDDLRLGIFS
jgi:hypothetical protein